MSCWVGARVIMWNVFFHRVMRRGASGGPAQPVDDVLKALASGDPEGAGELAKRMLANGHKYFRTGSSSRQWLDGIPAPPHAGWPPN